ncbi:MAG: hypothetical protein LC096_01835, partial [Bacteroidia bacterium]|nr:hypothetical protein [Bacteroidia bacterium]
AKVKTNEQTTMLEALLHKHSNLNDVQVRDLYNTVASTLIWPTITESTVANKRVELGIAIHIGRHGIKDFVNKKSYTVKRSAPKSALTYWTLDGWVAELLYQQKEQRSTSMVTTYHNRLTVVVVLDTCVKYPIGYAIGKQEDTSLIKQALKNAVNHTRELFGTRYKSNQLQTDNFGGAELKDLYSAVTGHYTPARVGNAKAKVIEPYFSYLNKKCQVYFDNWSGFNVDSRKENQPNAEFIQKNRSLLPDENGVRNQIHQLLQMERTTKLVEYKKFFEALPEEDRKPISNEEFLYLFGETHSHTNKLNGDGITPVLLGQSLSFDTFNERFRQYAYMDWAIKYDPEDLTQVLAVNAKSDHNSKVTEVIGSHQFLLDQKYVQPMALYERKDGDGAELSKVQQFNKNLGQKLLNRHDQVNKAVEQTFAMHDELNDTLKKMILPDSTGNYKKLKQAAERKKTVKTEPKQLPVANTDFEIIETDIRQQY